MITILLVLRIYYTEYYSGLYLIGTEHDKGKYKTRERVQTTIQGDTCRGR